MNMSYWGTDIKSKEGIIIVKKKGIRPHRFQSLMNIHIRIYVSHKILEEQLIMTKFSLSLVKINESVLIILATQTTGDEVEIDTIVDVISQI